MKESKRIISIILLIAIAVAIITACTRSEASRQLEAADAVMEENPDSALRILESIDTLSLVKERDLHLRELLLAQARVKLNYDDIDTVPLARAQRFFSAHPEKNYRLRSNFYMGDIAETDSSFIASAGYAADAFLEARDREDSYWLAKSAELISFILNRCKMPGECLKYDSIAIQEYAKADKVKNSLIVKIDLISDLTSIGRRGDADNLFIKTINEIKSNFPTDSVLVRYALVNGIDIKIQEKEFDEVQSILCSQEHYVGDKDMNALEILYKANYLLCLDSIEKAKKLTKRVEKLLQTSYDRLVYERTRKRIALTSGDSATYISAQLGEVPVLKHVNEMRSNNPILRILRDKDNAHSSLIIGIQKRKVILAVGIICLLIIIFAIIYIGVNRQRRKRDKEFRCLYQEFKNLEKSIVDYKKDIAQVKNLSEEYKGSAETFYQKYSNEVVRHNAERDKSKKLQHDFNNSTKNIIPIQNIVLETLHDLNGCFQNDKNRIEDMSKRLNRMLNQNFAEQLYSILCLYKGDLIDRFIHQVPGISPQLLKYFVFSAAGFSTISISYLLSEKDKATYIKRSRLIKKIEESEAEDKILFLNIIKRTAKGKDLNDGLNSDTDEID